MNNKLSYFLTAWLIISTILWFWNIPISLFNILGVFIFSNLFGIILHKSCSEIDNNTSNEFIIYFACATASLISFGTIFWIFSIPRNSESIMILLIFSTLFGYIIKKESDDLNLFD